MKNFFFYFILIFLSLSTPVFSQGYFDVIFEVNVSSFLASGNSLAPNGIRIAGNFADFGAVDNMGNAINSWNPTDAASGMIHIGSNWWRKIVRFPHSVLGDSLEWKFVNGNWGSQEGGLNLINCGVNYGGNIKRRVILFPVRYRYNWDSCSVSCVGTISGIGIDSFTVQPTSQVIVRGNRAAFHIQYTDSNVTYNWQMSSGQGFLPLQDNSTFSGSSSPNLLVNSIDSSFNNLLFRCVVYGCNYIDTSNFARLNIQWICDSIIQQPISQIGYINGSAQFEVNSSNQGSTYSWESNCGFGWNPLDNAGQYTGVFTPTLVVSNLLISNRGHLFRCVVTDVGCGAFSSQVSSSASLNIVATSGIVNVPKKFTYQSVVRDSSGQLITNHNLRMRLSLQRAPQMTNLYIENHQLTTNSNGLLTCLIGSGQPYLGMMDTIDWSLGNVYIQTEIDLTGGNNFVTLGNQELLSVPYALYSLNSGSSTPGPQGPQGPTGPQGPIGPQGAFPSGTQPGEMNYWNGTNWVTVPPGNRGQALIFCDGIPVWGGCLPQVSTNPVVSIRGTATTGGNVLADGGVYVSVKGVVYDTFPSPTLANRYTINGSDTGSFISELGLLISFIPYYVRSYATNSVGTAYGNEVNFTSTNILPSVITEPVTFVNGIAKSGGNVLSDGGAFVTAKGVVYDTLPSPTLSNKFTIDGSDTGSFTCYLRELIVSTPYYLRSYATNSVGTAYGNQVTFTAPLAVGNIFGGGTVFYLDSSGQHGLACAPSGQGYFEWGCYGTDIVGTSNAIGTGQANTNLILSGCSDRPIAASVCDDLVLNGYSDWYLPNLNELQLMYGNLHVQGICGFSNGLYWSSSQDSTSNAWYMDFGTGGVSSNGKYGNYQVRAVRAF